MARVSEEHQRLQGRGPEYHVNQMATAAEEEQGAETWMDQDKWSQFDQFKGSCNLHYHKKGRHVKGLDPLEEWVLDWSTDRGSGDESWLHTRWLSSFALARLLPYWGWVHRSDTPLVILARCQRLGIHYRALRWALGPLSKLADFRRWSPEIQNLVEDRLEKESKTQIVWVKRVEELENLPQEWQDGLCITWLDSLPDADDFLHLDPIFDWRHRIFLRDSLPDDAEDFGLEYQAPPPDAVDGDPLLDPLEDMERDVWWLHGIRLLEARKGTEVGNHLVPEDEEYLSELSARTLDLIYLNPGNNGYYFHLIRLATRLERDLTNRIRRGEQDDLDMVPSLEKRGELIPSELGEVWDEWVEAYRLAAEEAFQSRTKKAMRFRETCINMADDEIAIVPTNRAQAKLRAYVGWGRDVAERILSVEDVDWLRLLREGEPDGFPEEFWKNWRPRAQLIGLPLRKTMERLLQGPFTEVTVWTYPHEARRLGAWTRRFSNMEISSTDPGDIEAPERPDEELKDLSEDEIEGLLGDWTRPSERDAEAGTGGRAERSEFDEDVMEISGEHPIRMIFHQGDAWEVAPHRRLFALDTEGLRQKAARRVQSGDVILEVPRLGDRTSDVVEAAVTLDHEFEAIRERALEWRSLLMADYEEWKRGRTDGTASFSAFHRQELPSVDVETSTVIQWLNGETETPHKENMQALMTDLGISGREQEEMLEAQSDYRSLRMKAYKFIRRNLVSMATAERQGEDWTPPSDEEDFSVFEDLLLAHLEEVRFHRVEEVDVLEP